MDHLLNCLFIQIMKPIEITPEMKANHFIEWFDESATTEAEKRMSPLYAGKIAYEIGRTHNIMAQGHSNYMANFFAKVESICKKEFTKRNR